MMRITDMTIGTRLALAFGVVIFLVTLTGTVSYIHSKRLWAFTADIYDHPLQTSRSVRDIKADITAMHRSMKDLILADNETELQMAITSFETLESQVEKSFDAVYVSYLGDKSDIDTCYKMFREWISITDETIRLLRIGEVQTAENRTKITGTGGAHVEKMMHEINELVDFAASKGDHLYSSAATVKRKLDIRLFVLLISVYLLTATVTFLILKAIRQPLKELTAVADEYRHGNYSIRSDYNSKNEIGVLAATFNEMALSVHNDMTVKENAAWISQLIMDENELKPFCKVLLHTLVAKTESQIAAVYLLNKTDGTFEHYESIGLSHDRLKVFSASQGEGEFGAVIAQKKIIHISDIADDTCFSFSTFAGLFRPKEIISIPVIDNNEVIAVISLANLKCFTDISLLLLDAIHGTINARLLGVLSFQKIKDFSAVLDLQNRELDQKSKELVMQSDELKEYNIELEQQKRQLDEANKLKSAFLSNMSHELRTPLNSVIALSGVLNRRLNGKISEDDYNYIGIIEKNGKSLLALINDILDLSRIESGREEITVTRFPVSELICDITEALEPVTSEKKTSISYQIPADLPMITSDRTKCNHILQNVISNAVKFTEEGEVKITAWSDNENLHIRVSDTGIGIHEEFLPFIFDEFRQADDQASRKFGGTGLGLSIVKKYCRLLGADIDVKSKQGSGSTFTLVFPLIIAEFNKSTEEPEMNLEYGNRQSITESIRESARGKTLLLVEDSEPQIIQLTDILREEGINIQVARNGREALESIQRSVPDAMILDLQMPEVDGFEVLKKIRDLEETKSIPVLILTSKHITKTELSFLKENHIYQLIQKGSLNRNDLLTCVNNLFSPKIDKSSTGPRINKKYLQAKIKPTILVIEDNEDNLITLKALLEEDYLIMSARDGYAGLTMAGSEVPDLILLDISLPGLDGYKVLDEIRKVPYLDDVRVIALTARAMKGDREALLAYGFDGYISKPIENRTFAIAIKEYLANRR